MFFHNNSSSNLIKIIDNKKSTSGTALNNQHETVGKYANLFNFCYRKCVLLRALVNCRNIDELMRVFYVNIKKDAVALQESAAIVVNVHSVLTALSPTGHSGYASTVATGCFFSGILKPKKFMKA